MNFEYSNKVKDLQDKLTNFMNEHVYKNEAVYKEEVEKGGRWCVPKICLLYTSPSPRDAHESRMPSSA